MSDATNVRRASSRTDSDYVLSDQERARLEEMDVRDPDELLTPPRSSRFAFVVGIAVLCHVVVIGITSIALLRDWQQYGVKMPATIREAKKQEQEAAQRQQRDAKIEAERGAAVSADTENPKEVDDGSADASPRGDDAPPAEDDRDKPADSFDLDDLDGIDLDL